MPSVCSLLRLAVSVAVSAGCDAGNFGGPVAELHLEAVADNGDGQLDTVLATLRPLRVRVMLGRTPAPGATVTWTSGRYGAREAVDTQATKSDDSGFASLALQLGAKAGTYYAVASVTEAPPSYFALTAVGGQPSVVVAAFGDQQVGLAGEVLSPFGATVLDGHGNALAGQTVVWQVVDGGGSLLATLSVTSSGRPGTPPAATNLLTLGALGARQRVSAWVPGAAPAVFGATGADLQVTLGGRAFSPESVAIGIGHAVLWRWSADRSCPLDNYYYYYQPCPPPEAHNVTFEDDPSGGTSSPTGDAGSFARAFAGPTTVRYRCTVHSTGFQPGNGEVGVVVVR